jgi:MFS family permease
MRRRVLAAFVALGAWWGVWGALVPDVQDQAGVGDGQLGVAVAFVGVGALASMRATGGLIDRHGDAVLPVTVVVFAVAGVLPAVAAGPVALAATLAAVGVTSGALDVAANTSAVDAEGANGRPLLNLAHGSFSLAVIGASALTGLVRAAGASPFAVLAGTAAVLIGCAALVVAWQAPSTRPARRRHSTPHPWWRPPRRLLLIGALTALAFLVESTWQNWSALHLERDMGATPFVGSLGPALFGAAAAAGRLGGHRLDGRFPRQALLTAGAMVAAAGTLLAALAPSTGAVFAGIVAAGLGTAICAPILFGLAGAGVDAERRGGAIGTVATLGYLGFVLAPAAVGLLASALTLPAALAMVALAAVGLAVGGRRIGTSGPSPVPSSEAA